MAYRTIGPEMKQLRSSEVVYHDDDQHQAEQQPQNSETEYHGFAHDDVSDTTSGGLAASSHPTTSRWSGSTSKNPSTITSHKRGASSTSSFQKLKSASLSKSGSWTPEVVALVFGLGAVAAVIGVLARFNGRPLPEWPYYITINALIALLTAIANSTLSVSLSSGIGQLKWIRYKMIDAPLMDMEVFDDASRGSWGAVRLITGGRGGLLGSLGASVAILALALGPFAQQIAVYRLRNVESDLGATIPRAMNYDGALPGNSSTTGFVPILPLKAAVYNGLFAENNRPAASLQFECKSGNCRWESFDTLAVCYFCTDVSDLMTRYCDADLEVQNKSMCGWETPQGARLNKSSDVFSMTSFIPSAYGDAPHNTITRLTFMGTELHDTQDKFNPWAKQCTLSACVNTLSSEVINGTLTENITHSVWNNTVIDMSDPNPEADYGVYIHSNSNETFLLSMPALLSMRGWFAAIFTNGSATRTTEAFNRSITDPNRAVVVNLTVGISSGETFFDSDIVTAFYWNYYQYTDGLDMLMSDLAVSMTTAFRGFKGAEPVQGVSITVENYVHVRWGFAALPIAVTLLTVLFLVASMLVSSKTGTQLWKSNALALLFHGLDQGTAEHFAVKNSFKDKREQAKRVMVRLDDMEGSELLLRERKEVHSDF